MQNEVVSSIFLFKFVSGKLGYPPVAHNNRYSFLRSKGSSSKSFHWLLYKGWLINALLSQRCRFPDQTLPLIWINRKFVRKNCSESSSSTTQHNCEISMLSSVYPSAFVSCSHSMSLSGFLDEGLEELFLADRTVVILVHRLEVFQEGFLVKLSVWLDTVEHSSTELAHLVLLQFFIAIRVNVGKQLLSCVHELLFTDLCLLCLCHSFFCCCPAGDLLQ